MNSEYREEVLRQLRHPGVKGDMLIERFLAHPNGPGGCLPYTKDVAAAMSLLPKGVHFLCGCFEGGERYWCDVGFRPQVQAWWENLACAIAGAAFSYRTHPDVVADRAVGPGSVSTSGL